MIENKLNQIENPDDFTEQYQVRGQRNLKEFMQSKRKNMQTATSQQVVNKTQDKVSDSESINKYKTLFKKEDEMSEPDVNSSNDAQQRELFDLSALHKRNERHR